MRLIPKKHIVSYFLGFLIHCIKSSKDHHIWLGRSGDSKDYVQRFLSRGRMKTERSLKLKISNNYRNTMTKFDYMQVSRALNEQYVPGQSIIEVGAGYGRILTLLEQDDRYNFISIEGFDISECLITNKICKSTISYWNILEAGDISKCDIVIVWAVFMYLDNDQIYQALNNLLDVGQQLIILELPNTYYRLDKILSKMESIYRDRVLTKPIYTF